MSLRNRSREGEVVSGLSGVDGWTLDPVSAPMLHESVTDEVSPGDNHYFEMIRRRCDPISQTGVSGIWKRINYPLVRGQDNGWLPITTLGAQSDGAYAASLLAMTNPSRSVVDVPVFIGELGDLPRLVKIIGDSAIKTVARGNLAFWFGWKPLISDIMKMMNFSDAAMQRYKELKAFYDSGLSRTRDLDSFSAMSTHGTHVFESNGALYVAATKHSHTTQRIWGHCKWKPTTLPPKTDQDMINLARRAALGLTIDPSTAWELIPFSWMIDWFSSVGSFLKAQRNIVPAEAYDISIMRQTTTRWTFSNWQFPPGAPVRQGGVTSESKIRRPASASISAHLPYLSGRQLSILGSLAILSGIFGRRG